MLHFYSHGSVIRNNIYSHGVLEDILNNDLLYGKKNIPVGINDCIVDDYYNLDGERMELILWRRK